MSIFYFLTIFQSDLLLFVRRYTSNVAIGVIMAATAVTNPAPLDRALSIPEKTDVSRSGRFTVISVVVKTDS